MKLDELAAEAGRSVRDATRQAEPPTLDVLRSMRRRRTGVVAVTAAFVVTVGLIGVNALWPTSGVSEPVGLPDTSVSSLTTPPSTVPPTSVSVPETVTRDVLLLDGRWATVTSPRDLAFLSYSFFLESPAVQGEQFVVVTQQDPVQLASQENAAEVEQLTESATLWIADREGRPLFMSVDLGFWTVWLSVGSEEDGLFDRPGVVALAGSLEGSASPQGVVLPNLDLADPTLLFIGTGGSIRFRIGDCVRERVPGSVEVGHPRHGTVLRTDRYASWCQPDGVAEITVGGMPSFVDSAIETVSISAGEPVQGAFPAEGPIFFDQVQWTLLFDDGIDGLLAVDPNDRVGTRRVIEGQRAGDQPYRLGLIDNHFVVGWGLIYASPIDTGESFLLGEATIWLPAGSDRVWLIDYPGGAIGAGTPQAWQVRVSTGETLTEPIPVHVDGLPTIGVRKGLAIVTETGIAIWDADERRVIRRLGTQSGWISDFSLGVPDRLAWCEGPCTDLHITDVDTGAELVITHPDGVTSFDAGAARFSNDRVFLAAPAQGDVVVVDLRDGTSRVAFSVTDRPDPLLFVAWAPFGPELFASTYSYGDTTTTLVYHVPSGITQIAHLPFGGTLDMVVLGQTRGAPLIDDQQRTPEDCPAPTVYPSNRGICGFRF